MIHSETMASELLAASAPAYAAIATNRLLEKLPEVQQQFGETAFRDWKDHFQQRVLELSAALAENEPRLFASRVDWAKSAFKAREVSDDFLRESLVCLREVLDEELPETSRQAPSSFIDAALDSLTTTAEESYEVDLNDPNAKLAMQYLLKILEGDSRSAIRLVVDAVNEGLPVADAYEHVLLAAQREIGKMWHHAEISVAEEHYVTATTVRAMSVLCVQADMQPSNGLTVVSAAVAQNSHEIGVRAVSDFFELAGWRSVCLGGDTPAADIAEAVKCFGANLVLISAALSTQLRTVRKTIQAIRDQDANCKIMVGGMAFGDAPEIWRQVGADGYATTLSKALERGTELVKS
jgi:methanogenic corrinoid protein MtbC1